MTAAHAHTPPGDFVDRVVSKLRQLHTTHFQNGGVIEELELNHVNGHVGVDYNGATGVLLTDPSDSGAQFFTWHVEKGIDLGVHRHRVTEMVYILEGTLVDEYNGKRYEAGDLAVWRPNELHRPSFPDGPCKYNLIFTPSLRLKFREESDASKLKLNCQHT